MAVTDDFNRADGGLGANWTDTIAGLVIVSNAVQATTNNPAIAFYSGTLAGDTHSSQVTYVSGGTGNNAGPAARVQVGGAYLLYLRDGNFVRLYYYDGSYNLLDDYGLPPTLGRTYKIAVNGTTITAYENGSLIGTTVDGSISGGQYGIWGDGTSTLALDDWEGTGETVTLGIPIGRQLCS